MGRAEGPRRDIPEENQRLCEAPCLDVPSWIAYLTVPCRGIRVPDRLLTDKPIEGLDGAAMVEGELAAVFVTGF